jgi:hypothetical protein
MSQGPDWEARTRSKFLVRLGGAIVVLFWLATAASAAISSISPSSGTVEPRKSVSASFTVVDSLTSCFTASTPRGFEVTFNGLTINCALEGAEVTMTVEAGAKVGPGDYVVTINETSIEGELLATHTWPITVPAPPTTTTTIPTTTTTRAETSTTSAATTTSTQSATTSSTQSVTTTSISNVTSTTRGTTNTTSGDPVASGNPPSPPGTSDDPATATSGEGDKAPNTETGAASTDPSDPQSDDETEVLAAASAGDDDLPYVRYPANRGDVAPEVLSRTVFSDQLRDQLSRALPLAVADAVLTPVVVVEFLYQSLLQSAMGLLVPILLAVFVGLLMVWRMREEIDDDELALSRQSMG